MKRMKTHIFVWFFMMVSALSISANAQHVAEIQVTGSATINIVPDRITIEIGIEEYYKHRNLRDSSLVKLSEIEKKVRKILNHAGVSDSDIIVSDIGNIRQKSVSSKFLMAKRLSVTLTDFDKIESISDNLDREGIMSLNIVKIDNSDMKTYDRQGLNAALEAAKMKAEQIMENEKGSNLLLKEIVETGPSYYESPTFTNVAFNSGSGMEDMRRIVRRYSVKVKYYLYM